VERMEEDTSPTIIGIPSGRRHLGRPKQRWKDQSELQDQEQVLMDLNLNISLLSSSCLTRPFSLYSPCTMKLGGEIIKNGGCGRILKETFYD
jgi:hypothetical protein